ncbi:MAG: hypothetical protein WCP70_05335 [Methanothrix sp.]
MKADYLLSRIAIAALLLCSISLGGLDQSGNSGAENLTISEFSALAPASNLESVFVDTGAPQATSGDAGTEIAAYTEQVPPVTDLKKLMPSAVLKSPPRYMYYNGDYLAWNDFTTSFPTNNPGLWIERAVSWTQYATLPWGGWTRELIYVPQASPVTMYEIYPSGYVLGYSLGLVQSGYYYIWYYADTPGRHRSLFATNNGYSNAVIIDVYSPTIPKPTPDPKRECEARSSDTQTCEWRDGRCQCYMKPAPNPVADCEARSSDTQTCEWSDGRCQCYMKPAPNPVADCENNPLCDYVDGHCYCRGLDPEPMPGPVPNPNPEPMPGPVPNPVADCPDGCYWADGGCKCMGLGGGVDNSNNGGGDADLTVAE